MNARRMDHAYRKDWRSRQKRDWDGGSLRCGSGVTGGLVLLFLLRIWYILLPLNVSPAVALHARRGRLVVGAGGIEEGLRVQALSKLVNYGKTQFSRLSDIGECVPSSLPGCRVC